MIININQKEFQDKAWIALNRVFNIPLNMLSLFSPTMEKRVIFYHSEFSLPKNVFAALKSTASDFGENGFYFSFVEYDRTKLIYPGVFESKDPLATSYFKFSDEKLYNSQYFITNHLLFSPGGLWGVFVGYDEFLMVAGEEKLMNNFLSFGLDYQSSTKKFLMDWRLKKEKLVANVDWIPPFLSHAYGKEMAKELLKENFPELESE
jgi:hypothetical protein